MDEPELRDLADAIETIVRPLLARSEPARRAVRLIGEWLVQQAEHVSMSVREADPDDGEYPTEVRSDQESPVPATSTAPPTERGVASPQDLPAPPAGPGPAASIDLTEPVEPRTAQSEGVVPLRIGDVTRDVVVRGTEFEIERARESGRASVDSGAASEAALDDLAPSLGLVHRRARLKAKSCRHFIELRASRGDPEREDRARSMMHELISEGKSLPNCFLWVYWRDRTPPDDQALLTISACYDALADGASLADRLSRDARLAGELPAVMRLLAQASSALRVALTGTWLGRADQDQEEVHTWLVRETQARRVYIDRYMRLDDPADPGASDQIREAVAAVAERLGRLATADKRTREALNRARYHARQILGSTGDDARQHFIKIALAVKELEALGASSTDARLREAIGPDVAALFPSDLVQSPFFQDILDGLTSAEGDDQLGEERAWSSTVSEARSLLAGRGVVIVGGVPKSHAIAKIESALEAPVEWVELTEHGSGGAMRAPIARAENCVVALLIRFTGHQHGDEAAMYAKDAGKPVVRLKAGYNPEQIAHAIVEQAADRLRVAPMGSN